MTSHWHAVDVNIYALLDCLYAVSAVLITFGALIGKISPFQLVVMTVLELVLHSVNLEVLMGSLGLTDMGGTYTDRTWAGRGRGDPTNITLLTHPHPPPLPLPDMFGAYFGLAVSLMLGPPDADPHMSNTSDLFSFVGTLFLWIYWPRCALWPAWKCVLRAAGPSYPGTPTQLRRGGRGGGQRPTAARHRQHHPLAGRIHRRHLHRIIPPPTR